MSKNGIEIKRIGIYKLLASPFVEIKPKHAIMNPKKYDPLSPMINFEG